MMNFKFLRHNRKSQIGLWSEIIEEARQLLLSSTSDNPFPSLDTRNGLYYVRSVDYEWSSEEDTPIVNGSVMCNPYDTNVELDIDFVNGSSTVNITRYGIQDPPYIRNSLMAPFQR